ncbi:MAG: S8 family serine peptidase [Pyrinomonadaceae bacterium]|nr:S8 family serine peptidase [Pyrinomonadaceae bacterium]
MPMRILLFIAIFTMTAATSLAQFSHRKYVENELLVKLRPTASDSFFARTGTEKIEDLYRSDWTKIRVRNGKSVSETISNLRRDSSVIAVQPNFYYFLDTTPDDPQFGSLWGMTMISAPAAWDTETGDSNTIVAVIDTGIQYTHEDIAANMWINPLEIPGNGADDDSNGKIDDVYGYDFFFDDADPDDEHGHGTHVAGTIGAVGNNTLGVAGVNWNVRMMAIKIYDSTGFGTTSAMLINAYNYVTAMKQRGENIRVTNNSYGGCDEACDYDQATKDAIDAMGNAGILNVYAAGNQNSDVDASPHYPGSYGSAYLLNTASSTSSDAKSGFSNFGIVNVDIAAPGSGIFSTIFNGTGYGTKSGTSMASPHAAGAAALLSSHNPSLSNMSLKATLMNSVDHVAAFDGVVKTGGRLNVANALSTQTVCDLVLDPASQHVFPEGGSFSIDVTAPDNCDYEIGKDAAAVFVDITSASPGSGNSAVTYTVGSNSSLPRGGKILIGDKEFMVTQSPGELFPHRGFIDFNGDGWTDLTSIRDEGGQMIWEVVFPNLEVPFGLFADDIPIPGHYDTDLINDIAVWRRSTGTFYILKSSDGSVQIVNFGLDGDNPLVTQDFDGDDIYDLAVTRKQGGKLIWYILRSSDGGVTILQFGNETDTPIRGDYDGDGKADVAVYRPETDVPANTFYVLKSSDQSVLGVTFGSSSIDELVPNDFDGDGMTDFAVWRTSTGDWHLLKSGDNFAYEVFHFGSPGDLPTPGDYDGDGRTDYSVWRPGAPGGLGTHFQYSLWQGFNSSVYGADDRLFPANIVRTR